MNEVFQKIKKTIESSKTTLVSAHEDPDGDTIGSMIALSLLLRNLGLQVTMYSPDPIPHIYAFLPNIDEVKREIKSGSHFDLGIAVDAGDIKRVRIPIDKISRTVINIDHHPDNTMFGHINYVERVSSVAEQIYKLCGFLGIKIDRDMAECLYAAMITDTGNFRYENTTVETFKIAADLLKAGADPNKIAINIYDTKSISSLRILAEALRKIDSTPDGRIVWAEVTKEMMKGTSASSEDLTGIVDHLRSVKGAEVAILFREEEKRVKVNFRSKEKINVSKIAKSLGGGGHIRAAGCVIAGKLHDVKKKVIDKVLRSI